MSDSAAHAYANWPDADEDSLQSCVATCSRLRTKTAFGSLVGGVHTWQEGKSSTAVYWCLATMSQSGPDDKLVHPHVCQRGRACFEDE